MADHRVDDHGTTGDGVGDDTTALQAAVDAAHRAGGGRVVLGAGRRYRCGSLRLRSNVELHLEPGSRLIAATSIESFSRRITVGALASGVSGDSVHATGAMVWAEDADNVAITGRGVIDGSATAYIETRGEQIHVMSRARPFPVFLIGCRRVDVRDVRFVDAALWTLRLSGCQDVVIDGIRIDNDMLVPNSDGIDIDHCTRVRIVGCDIRCPDDAISLKTTDEFVRFGPCEDVVVTGCTLESKSNAVTLGVDADSPIRRVVVTACTVRNSHRGVSVSVGTGCDGYVEDVLFSDLVIETRHYDDEWWGCGEPIVVRSAPWHEEAGAVRHVRFRNILARSENGVLIHAAGDGAIEDVEISDLRLELRRWTELPGHRLDLRPFDHAPSRDAIRTGLLRCRPAAIRVHGADGVRLRDVTVHRSADDAEFDADLLVENSIDVVWDQVRTPGRTGQAVLDNAPAVLEGTGAHRIRPPGAAANGSS